MRVAIVDTYYAAFVRSFYKARSGLVEASFDEQRAALLAWSFGTSDAYSHHLRASGHEAIDLIVDVEALQLKWAAETDRFRAVRAGLGRGGGRVVARLRRRLLQEIALAQLEEFAPDAVYCHNLAFFSRRQLDGMRARGWLVAGQIASPLPDDELLHGFDLVVTSFPHFVERLRMLGIGSEYLPLAIDTRVIERLERAGGDASPVGERPHPIVFVGGVDPRVHPAGTALLEQLCQRLPVEVWGYGADALPVGSAIRERYNGEAWGLEMYRVLSDAKVAVNRHIDVAEGASNNMRLYEATGMGAALATDRGHNLRELFEPGEEVATYTSPEELVEAIEALLADEGRRLTLAAAGQRRTLSDHTFASRMRELGEMLGEYAKRRR